MNAIAIRELAPREIDAVSGGWVWVAAGAVGGALQGVREGLSDDGKIDGGEALGIVGDALMGAIGGRAVELGGRAIRAGYRAYKASKKKGN